MNCRPKKQLLTIQIPCDEDVEEKYSNQIDQKLSEKRLHRISSTKNAHQMKKFIFPSPAKVNYDRVARQEKIRKLQRQKQELLESIQLLKNGALNCIIQKDQTIAKLRSILTSETPSNRETRVQQVDRLLQYIKDLEDERKYLRQELEAKRRQYERDLSDKDSIIDELNHELNWSSIKIQRLQKYDELLQQKIRVMQADNQNLSIMLNQSQESLKNQRFKLSQDEISQTKDADTLLINSSQFSDIKANDSNASRDHPQYCSLIHQIDQQLVQCKVKEMKQQHELQIQDLTHFYESRIQSLKQICDKSFEYIPLLNITSPKNIQKIPENYSLKSINSSSSHQTLKKKFSTASLKSQNLMQPIDERQELPSPRKSLKQEIDENSDCFFFNRINRKFDENDTKSEGKSEHSFKFYEIPSIQNQNSNRFKKKKEEDSKQKWDKVLWFTLGTLAGGSLLTLGQKIFK